MRVPAAVGASDVEHPDLEAHPDGRISVLAERDSSLGPDPSVQAVPAMGREGFEPSTLGLRDRSVEARPLFQAVLR